jgi:hypothetical protein
MNCSRFTRTQLRCVRAEYYASLELTLFVDERGHRNGYLGGAELAPDERFPKSKHQDHAISQAPAKGLSEWSQLAAFLHEIADGVQCLAPDAMRRGIRRSSHDSAISRSNITDRQCITSLLRILWMWERSAKR